MNSFRQLSLKSLLTDKSSPLTTPPCCYSPLLIDSKFISFRPSLFKLISNTPYLCVIMGGVNLLRLFLNASFSVSMRL